MFCGQIKDHGEHRYESTRFGTQTCIGRPGHDELFRDSEYDPRLPFSIGQHSAEVKTTVSLDEMAALARAHPLELELVEDEEAAKLQIPPWCPGCGAFQPCLIARLINMLRNPRVRCVECDFSRRHQRDDTPEHDCPEAPRTASLYMVEDELRMLTPDQVEGDATDTKCTCGDTKDQHQAALPHACWNPDCPCPEFSSAGGESGQMMKRD